VKAKLREFPGAPRTVYGEIRTPAARHTIVFNAHYDGQPLDPKPWATPPWQLVLHDRPLDQGGQIIPFPEAGARFDPEWRIYARSASDDKAPITAMTSALDTLNAAHIPLQSNIRLIFEGEEEGLAADIIAANKELLGGHV
jgi:acetylornithine deacetylase/succinyl-diaminopimelate desuccinylase-like protein